MKTAQGRARELGGVVALNAEIDPRLDEAIEAFRIRDRRTKKAVITMALEEFLERHAPDLWPGTA